MAGGVESVRFGAEATAALEAAIRSAQAADAMAAVTVAVPSNYAGLSLRKELARKSPLINVRFLVLSRVAELLGAPALAGAGRRPLAKWVRGEAIRAALAAHLRVHPESVFADVTDHIATEKSLETTFRDLREANPATLERIAASSRRALEVVQIFERFRAVVAGYYDETDLAEEASRAVASNSPALRDIGHLVVFLPRSLSEAEGTFITAMAAAGRATVIIGLTNDQQSDNGARAIEARLALMPKSPRLMSEGEPLHATHIVAVQDAQEEVRMVTRMAMERLRAGTPLYRMAVLYPVKDQYAAGIHEQFAAAGIPHNGASVGTLAQSIAGRFLLALLGLPSTHYRRDAVMDWLTSGPVLADGRRPAPAGHWDGISREAGVVAEKPGTNEWDLRLSVYCAGQNAALESTERPPSESRIERIGRDIESARQLQQFMGELKTNLRTSTLTTWAQYGEWALGLLKRYMGASANFTGCPTPEHEEAERSAYEKVVEQLENLGALDVVAEQAGVARRVDEGTFRRALEQMLESPGSRTERFGTGVFVGKLGDAAGMRFDTVFMLGMVEGQAPSIGRDDPLLPDSERKAAGDSLPLRQARRDDEARQYHAALACADERILFFPASDLGGQRKHLPSRWLLASAKELSGAKAPMGTKEFVEAPAGHWLTRVASFHEALNAREHGSLQEYDLALLRDAPQPERHPLATAEPGIGRGIAAIRGRQAPGFSRWDGAIGPRDALRPTSIRPTSPTALETWATCPFRYFLKSVLYVEEREEPEHILVLSAAERGNIIHKALETFMEDRKSNPGRSRLEEWELLKAIAEEECAKKESAGIAGKPLLWAQEKERILSDLERFLEKDAERSAETGFQFETAEYSFGSSTDNAVVVTLADGSEVAFRGRIDRVDLDPDGRVAVYDYKSGKPDNYQVKDGDLTKAGQLLQLPVYALAARQQFKSEQPVSAYYWFVTARGGYQLVGHEVTEETLERFRRQVELIAQGIAGGAFPAVPGVADGRPGGPGSRNCTYCAYTRLCSQDRRRAWERKQSSEIGQVFLALAGQDGEAMDDNGGDDDDNDN